MSKKHSTSTIILGIHGPVLAISPCACGRDVKKKCCKKYKKGKQCKRCPKSVE